MADLLRRGVPRKEWLDAHIDRVPLWEQAAGRGTTHGLMMTGLCHWFGIGREVDHDAARPFLEAAANTGEPQSQFSLGQLFVKNAREGEGTETEGDAYRWFLVSAENGLAQAQFSVAEALWKGEGIEEDERAAVEWMRKAAAQGHGQAAYMLAELHLTNRPSAGIKKDRAMAIEWGRQAAVAGHEEAQGWLKKHEHGVVLTTDIAEQILENWRGNSDRHGPRSRTVGMSIGGDDTEDDDSPPAPSGPFADPPGTTTNSIGMKLVPIPAGEFLMGSSEDCPLGDSYEEFQHRVRITKPFMLGMHQVTQAQYQEVTGENPSFFEGPDLPVEHLSWKHAQRFCELLSSRPAEVQAGRRYRLPTEAEWEYACRAGTTTPFNTGDSLESDQARFASVSRSSPKHTAPVGTYPPNAWGLFDMHGNVWEWTNDWFSADYFRESPVDDPQGPTTGTHHTLRGGSASVESHECRSTIRGEADPADGPDADGSRYAFIGDFGLRVVCVAATAQPHDTVHSAVRSHAHGKAEAVRAISQQFRTRLSEVVDGVTKHINDNNAKEILGPGLSQLMGRGAIKSIVTFALYADVLRMVRDMVMADGEISDDEVQAGLGLMSLLASGFAKVRKDYAPHATLSAETTRAFLSQYEADAGLFGHANESTKWAGVSICRGIQSRCDDSRPLDVFGEALVAWAEAIASSDDITPVEQTALDTLRKYVGQEPSTAHFKQQAREALAAEQGDADAQEALDRLQPSESEAAPTNEDSDQLGSLLAAMDDGSTESAGAVIEYLQATVATPQNAWGVLLHYLDWDCTQPPNPEKDRVGTQSVPLRMPEWGPFAFSHDESLADLVSDEPPAVWQRFKNYFESREVTTVQYGDFEMGYWSAERLADTLTRIYSGTNIKMPVRVFFAAEADGSGIRIFTPLAIGGAIAPPIRASQRWVLEALFRMAEDDSRESVNKQLITIGGLLGRRGTFGKETPLNLHPAPVAWSNETLWVPLGDAWGRLKHPLPQLNVGYLVSKDLKGSAFEDCIDGAVTSLVTLVDWMASAAIENEQVSKQVLPWQPAILLAASASDALVDACHPAELTLAFARAERGDESAAASINEYLESAEDVDINDEDDDEPPPTPIGTFSDPPGTITNSIGMRLVPIPTGEFLMGSPADSPLGDSDEEFQHKVRITKPFLLGMHQVTQSQYEHVTGDNPSFFRGPQLPVEHLAWKDAKRFCDLLSALPGERQAGRRYRLPTEAEWEYACRAGTTTPFSTGDALEPDQARFAATNRSSPKQTAPVGTYPPNAWGLFDMHGNVWEWTSDWFSADYYRESPLNDPQGPASGTHHALRGGSASMEGHECHAAFRGEAAAVDGPETETLERIAFYGDLGIRVVCEATTKREPLGPSSLTHKLEPGTMRGRDALAENQPRQGTDNAATSPPPPPASDPTNSLSSRTVRIFISSTFRDFAGERDLLVRKVFPELRRRCRERQVELVDVDLRWGITEAEAEQGKVLPICLTEIDRARPFFMGLLGERYGWVPAVGQFDRSLLIEQPWLEEHAGEKSVTELEILHGVLNNPQMAGRAFFYFRDPAWSATQGADYTTESEAERQKLADLKVRIRESGFPVSEGYADPSTLAGIVLEDLWTALDKEFPAGTEPTPLEREALDHSAFAASRYTVFVGRDEHLQSLSNQVTHDRQPIVVIGEPGSGKSALLANWVRLQRSRATSAWIFEHYVGASAQSTTYADLIRRIIAEIASTLSIQAEVSDATADLVRQFPEWLEKLSAELKAKGTSAVLVLDGLDQMQDEDSAAELRWLPQQFPAGVQVMVSAQPGFGLETLKKRSWPIVSLPLLAEPDRKTLVRESLARYRKSLTTERLNLLASALAAANPLFLKALVDELRVCASHETLDEQIRNYLEASDPPALFAKVLERIETDHEADAPGLVRDALRLVWAARDGCSEAELLVLLKRPGEDHLPQAVWSPVYVAIEPFLVRRAGLYTLCHAFFRQAVQERYFADEKDARAAHRTLADFFEQQRPSPRAEREVPWQLYEAAEHGRLNAYLRLPGNFMPLLKNAANDLSRFLSVACANQDKSEFIRHVVTDHLTQQPDSWAQDILLVLWPLENLCERIGESPYWVGKFLNDNRPATLRRKFSVDTRGPKLLSMAAVADGSFTSQVDELVLETEDARIDPLCYAVKNAESLLYDCHYGDGVPADSTTTLTDIHSEMRRLLDAAERGFGQRAELETDYVTAEDEAYAWRSARREYLLLIGEIRALMAEKEEDYEQAHALLDGALVMAEGFWGTSHVELLPVLRAIVNTAKTSGDPSRGLSAAHRGLSLCLTDGGPTHPDIKWWLENYCHRSIDLGELAIAEDLCSEVLKKQESLVGTDHVELAYTLQTRAKVRYHSDDPTREKQDYQRALSILDAADEPDEDLRKSIVEQYETFVAEEHAADHNLAVQLVLQGDYSAAEPLFRRILEGKEQSLGLEHPATLTSVSFLALSLKSQRDYSAAESLHRRALEGREKVLGPDHLATLVSVDNLMFLLRQQGDYAAAEPLCRRALAGREKALGPDHPDTLKSVHNLALLLCNQGDYAAAEGLFRTAVAGYERALGPDHDDTLSCINNLAECVDALTPPAVRGSGGKGG